MKAFPCFPKISTVSTSPLNNLQMREKYNLKTFRTFVFHLKVAWKPFSQIFPSANFGFKHLWKKRWRMRFFKAQNICFSPQGSLKITFLKCFLWRSLRMLYLALPENDFNFVNQKLAKSCNLPFAIAQNIRVWP